MINSGRILLAASLVAVAFCAPDARAGQIVGSMTLVGTTANLNGASSLATATVLNFNSFAGTNTLQSGAATGDYGGVVLGSAFTTSALTLNNLAAFNFTSAVYGTFQATTTLGGFTSRVVTQSAGFLDVFLVGNYSNLPPSATNAAPTTTPTSVEFSFTQAGVLVSASGSLNSPPTTAAAVPEPASLSLVALGLLGVAGYSRSRRVAR